MLFKVWTEFLPAPGRTKAVQRRLRSLGCRASRPFPPSLPAPAPQAETGLCTPPAQPAAPRGAGRRGELAPVLLGINLLLGVRVLPRNGLPRRPVSPAWPAPRARHPTPAAVSLSHPLRSRVPEAA